MIIFLSNVTFTEHYYHKFELNNLNKFDKVKIWDLSSLLFDKKTLREGNLSQANDLIEIIKIDSLASFKNELSKTEASTIFINNIDKFSLLGIRINYLIQKKYFFTIEFYNSGIPFFKNLNINRLRGLTPKLFLEKLIKKIKNFVLKLLNKSLRMHPDLIMYSGSEKAKYLNENKEFKNIELVSINSWDLSNIILEKKNPFNHIEQDKFKHSDYILYVDGGAPKFSDSNLIGEKQVISYKWYESLNIYFEKLEKKLDKVVLIAGHPIAQGQDFSIEFNGRSVIFGKTKELIKEANLVLSRASSSSIIGAFYNRPMIFLTSNEIKKNNLNIYLNRKKMARELGIKYINIDSDFSDDSLYDFSYDKYRKFLKKYGSDRDDNMSNTEILINFLSKENDNFKKRF